MLISLIIAALVVVYALIFCGGTIFQLQDLYNSLDDIEYIEHAKDFYLATQGVSDTLLILGIVAILAVCLNYIMGTGNRRKYYITNYVAIGIVVAFEIVVAIVIIAMVANCQSILGSIDLEQAKMEYETTYPGGWKYSTWTMPVGYGLAAILILDAVGFVLNLVWKIKLMQGEKKLLESGLVKEVA